MRRRRAPSSTSKAAAAKSPRAARSPAKPIGGGGLLAELLQKKLMPAGGIERAATAPAVVAAPPPPALVLAPPAPMPHEHSFFLSLTYPDFMAVSPMPAALWVNTDLVELRADLLSCALGKAADAHELRTQIAALRATCPLPILFTVRSKREGGAPAGGASGGRGANVLSPALVDAVDRRLERKEQVILLLNRRGYSSFVQCRECGEVEQCENCSISLTYHRVTGRVVCHHCRFEAPAPARGDTSRRTSRVRPDHVNHRRATPAAAPRPCATCAAARHKSQPPGT